MKRYNFFLAMVLLGRILTFLPWVAIGFLVFFLEPIPVFLAAAWASLKGTLQFLANHIWEPIHLLRCANDPTYRHRKHLLATASPSWREMPWRLAKHSCGLAI